MDWKRHSLGVMMRLRKLTANATTEMVMMMRRERRRTSRPAIVGDMNVRKWTTDLSQLLI